MKNKFLTPLNIWCTVALIVVAIIFYWFGLRPSLIIKGCAKQSVLITEKTYLKTEKGYPTIDSDDYTKTTISNPFGQCLHEAGLK